MSILLPTTTTDFSISGLVRCPIRPIFFCDNYPFDRYAYLFKEITLLTAADSRSPDAVP